MTRLVNILFTIVLCTLFVVLFHWLGNTSDTHIFGTSVITWMVRRWDDVGGRFSYAAFIPFVFLWLMWKRRDLLTGAPRTVDRRGVYLVIACLLLHLLGTRLEQPRLSLLALAGLIWGIPFYLWGPAIARLMLFPCAYLLFCIPMTFLDVLSFPLRMFASWSATGLLNGIGIAAIRTGTAIASPRPDGFRLEVADPCSGLGYLLALLALSALFANLTQPTPVRQWTLFILAMPIAVIANIVRIFVIALSFAWIGHGAGTALYHYGSGYMVFLTAILLLFASGRFMAFDFRTWWRQWKSLHRNHVSS